MGEEEEVSGIFKEYNVVTDLSGVTVDSLRESGWSESFIEKHREFWTNTKSEAFVTEQALLLGREED